MKKTFIHLTAILTALNSLPVQGKSFNDMELVCNPIESTGFAYDKNNSKWESTNFLTHKFLVLKDEKFERIVREFPSNQVIAYCSEPINEYGFIFCGSSFSTTLKINVVGGRYIQSHTDGYFRVMPEDVRKEREEKAIKTVLKIKEEKKIDIPFYEEPTDQTSDTVSVEIGTCEELK